MARLRGITIQLYEKTESGRDDFNRPIYTETATNVDNVLIGQPSTEDVVDTFNLTGKRVAYTLAIPKGDTHLWINRKVSFYGEVFHTIGEPTQGIEDMIPLSWNKKVMVERYE